MAIGRRPLVLLAVLALVVAYLYLTGATQYLGSGSGEGQGGLGLSPAARDGDAGARSGGRGDKEPPHSDPFVLLSPARVVQPATVNLAGHRFVPGEEVTVYVRVPHGGEPRAVGAATADEEGLVPNITFNLPEDLGPGLYTVEARGSKGTGIATAQLEVAQATPWVTLDPYAAKAQETIAFDAGGFRPGEEVAVHVNSLESEPVVVARASATGDVRGGTLTVPFAGPGDNTLLFVGRESNYLAQTTFTLLEYTPYGLLGNYTPQPLQEVALAGEAFVPGEKVLVYLNEVGGEPVATLQADEEGKLAGDEAFTVPLGLEGENTLIFIGERSLRAAPAEFTVMPLAPALELTTYAVRPGGSVAFSGSGFAKGETLRAYVGEPKPGAEVSIFAAGDDGAFANAGEFALPYKTGGESVTLTVVGDASRTPVQIEMGVIGLEPSADLSAYFAEPASEITFSGYGFGAGEEIAVYVGDARDGPVARARADKDGSFKGAGPYSVPADAKERLSFRVAGVQSGAEAKVELQIGQPPPEAAGEDGGPPLEQPRP